MVKWYHLVMMGFSLSVSQYIGPVSRSSLEVSIMLVIYGFYIFFSEKKSPAP